VLVDSQGTVTRYQVEKSGGGLYFGSASELGGAAKLLLEDPTLRSQFAAAGEAYVREEFDWQAVLNRFDLVYREIFSKSYSQDLQTS